MRNKSMSRSREQRESQSGCTRHNFAARIAVVCNGFAVYGSAHFTRNPEMRRSFCFVLALLLFVPARASAQTTPTADRIIARYAERIGGADRIRAIQSVRRSGKFYGGGGFEAEVTYEN